MNKQPSWWSWVDPNLTLPLLAIIAYLLIVAIGNIFAIYQYWVVENNLLQALSYIASFFIYLVPAYGLFKMKRWARMLEIIISLFSVMLGLFLAFSGAVGLGLVIIIPHGLIAQYLLSRKCRQIFGYEKEG